MDADVEPVNEDDVKPDPDALPPALLAKLKAIEANMLEVYDVFVVAAAAGVLEERSEAGITSWPPTRDEIDGRVAECIMLSGELLLAAAFLRHGREDINDVWVHILDDIETALLKGYHRGMRMDSKPWESMA